MNLKEFLNNECPFPLKADAYSISSDIFASSKAREKSVYNFTNRISPVKAFPDVAKDSRMVFFGLQDYIRRYLTKPINQQDIDNSKRFMDRAHSFGGPLPFNKKMWESVLHDYNGYLPIKIEAIPQGSIFFPNEPVIQITAEKGFGELAAHVEGLLVGMVSIATVRASLTAHWKSSIYNLLVHECGHDEKTVNGVINWFIHDFGMRASSSDIESEILGKCHLLFFNGTDTFNAAFSAWRDSNYQDVEYANSIIALAHRNTSSYENDLTDGENDCFEKIYEVSTNYGGIASNVSDCYNFKKAVDKLERILAKNPDNLNIIVSRPDSGNAKENIEYILDKKNSKLRFIEGNSINPKSMKDILLSLNGKNVALKGIFGVGGYLRNSCTRDTFSSALKLSSVGIDNQPVCKLSEVEAKMSIPGPNILTKPLLMYGYKSVFLNGEIPSRLNRLKIYYEGDCDLHFTNTCLEDFNIIRDRAQSEFNGYDNFANKYPDYGVDCTHLSEKIIEFRQKMIRKYRG